MCNSDHLIKLLFAESHAITLGGVIEATGLFVNAFVEGDVLHDRTYVFSVECVSPKAFVIRAKLRHPLDESSFAHEQAFAPLYLLFVAWFLAGANVKIVGPWADSFPGSGSLVHQTAISLQLRPVFQDGLPTSDRVVYPSLEVLAEIHSAISHGAKWTEVKESPAFKECFPEVAAHPKDHNSIHLCHRSGHQLDLVIKQGASASHILACVQDEYDTRFMTCEPQISVVRTWWDAWIRHCPTTDLMPKQLSILPDEVAIFCTSGSIWRYRLRNMQTLDHLLEVDFGEGVDPTRSIDSWLQSANRFGEAGLLEIAIACCEQAIASATAVIEKAPGLAIELPIGVTPRQQLNDAETEYLRWLDYKESLNRAKSPHDRWNANVTCSGVRILFKRVGSQWQPALEEVLEAIHQEHYDSHDYKRSIGRIREFSWNVNGDFGTLKYRRLFGRELMDARVPKKAVSLLGYEFREEVIPSYVEFSDIFTLTLGTATFWGSAEERVLVSCSEPTQVYCLWRR